MATVRVALASALALLPSRQRQVVVMRYLADIPEAEVATSLGVSLNTVKKHASRGVNALRESLGSKWQESDFAAD